MNDQGNDGDESRLFVGAASGPPEFAAFFDEDRDGGYLCVLDRKTESIVRDLQIYDNSDSLEIGEGDVEIFWSADGTKCGVVIWGRMRGVINTAAGQEVSVPLKDRGSPAITDPEWLKGFDDYLDRHQFIKARQRYWKEFIKEHKPDAQPLPEDQTPIQTNFILYADGPNQTFGVFEDDQDSGYLYLYSAAEQTVLRFLHVYDRSPQLQVLEDDVRVVWSEDASKCGVVIWDKMRGIIDVAGEREGRVWLESPSTPGIADPEWLRGFN